jgi:hypothetical protein
LTDEYLQVNHSRIFSFIVLDANKRENMKNRAALLIILLIAGTPLFGQKQLTKDKRMAW